ncbi:MAG TPA: SDR family oxidoreductase, partial [Burkholderiaceae bacterium]|nr:SDR family oxidoreductase [Burkholderiaceae bacterium]
MSTVLVIGASRGIGLEFARQYAADGARVIATVRRAEDTAKLRELGAKPLLLDVLDEAAVAQFGAQLHGEKLDIAIYNTGVYGPRTTAIAAPGGLDFDAVMHTNVRAPMQLIPQLVPALASTSGKLALISSRMGSVSLMSSTSGWLYRVSKAAANAALRAASLELGPHGVVCVAFHPGWVRTEMGGAGADIDAATSVSG